ncbi:MAG: hypothetical protein J4F98_13095, partial [Acidobacteria bacterium]|nr:hypothetical protein [Acidobacteriota bacterium]
RSLFRLALDRPEIKVAAVAETADPDMLRYLLRFSTLPWPLDADVELQNGSLCVDGSCASVVRAGTAGEVPWGDLGVSTVVDFRDTQPTRSELEGHLEAGAERVVLCAPPGGELDRTVVVGLNDDRIEPSARSRRTARGRCFGSSTGRSASSRRSSVPCVPTARVRGSPTCRRPNCGRAGRRARTSFPRRRKRRWNSNPCCLNSAGSSRRRR